MKSQIKEYLRQRKLQKLYDAAAKDVLVRRDLNPQQFIESELVYYCPPREWKMAQELGIASIYGVRLVPALAAKLTCQS